MAEGKDLKISIDRNTVLKKLMQLRVDKVQIQQYWQTVLKVFRGL